MTKLFVIHMFLPTTGNQNFRIKCKSCKEIFDISPRASMNISHQGDYKPRIRAPCYYVRSDAFLCKYRPKEKAFQTFQSMYDLKSTF